ncbi:hypothetical protein NX722_26120 [Endozoicomonas gorgoniicola]|uniref:Cell surface protein n=1 Tax=Endozoicomonas gorgoniicola TaxID=1234144 RepID=A0ABT3N344_9GAMM|nr:hypothetical protein [Endozoicomonas gorgoniicola]MCW7556041.1 hypothetical protein [Endozoicomonas gorgoniicola]
MITIADTSSVAFINGIRFTSGMAGKVDSTVGINLHLTRNNVAESNNQGINVTGIRAGSTALTGQSGKIDISALGGNATGNSANSNTSAFGIDGDINGPHLGGVNLHAQAGRADSSGTGTDAAANVSAEGLTGDISGDNRAPIDVTGIAGSAIATGSGSAGAEAVVDGLDSDVEGSNYSIISAIAKGGSASADSGFADADAAAKAVDGDVDGNNYGTLTSYTRAGSATGSGTNTVRARAEGIGIYLDLEGDNIGTIRAEGYGGTAIANADAIAYAYADITGIDNGLTGENKGQIYVKAQGGSARTSADKSVEAYALAIGSKKGMGSNSGSLYVEAIGGTVQGSSSSSQLDASARAFGVGYITPAGVNNGNGVSGQFTNSGHINVRAEAGSANGTDDKAEAYGIVLKGDTNLHNSGLIDAVAIGGAGSGAYQVRADDNNLTVTAYGIRFGESLRASEGVIQANNPANVTFDNATLYV